MELEIPETNLADFSAAAFQKRKSHPERCMSPPGRQAPACVPKLRLNTSLPGKRARATNPHGSRGGHGGSPGSCHGCGKVMAVKYGKHGRQVRQASLHGKHRFDFTAQLEVSPIKKGAGARPMSALPLKRGYTVAGKTIDVTGGGGGDATAAPLAQGHHHRPMTAMPRIQLTKATRRPNTREQMAVPYADLVRRFQQRRVAWTPAKAAAAAAARGAAPQSAWYGHGHASPVKASAYARRQRRQKQQQQKKKAPKNPNAKSVKMHSSVPATKRRRSCKCSKARLARKGFAARSTVFNSGLCRCCGLVLPAAYHRHSLGSMYYKVHKAVPAGTLGRK